MIKVSSLAPDFSLLDQAGISHQLSDYRGSWVLLYFYPKDDTPGCTKEACQIRDVWSEYQTAGIQVLGVSADSVDSHHLFANKYNLPFPLLSDQTKKVVDEYGAGILKGLFVKKPVGVKRISYLIDPNGVVKKVYKKVQPTEHADQVLADVKSFQVQN